MLDLSRFLIIGDNVHTERTLPRGHVQMQRLKDGRDAIAFPAGSGKLLGLPIPEAFKSRHDYRAGNVPHVAVAIELGLTGSPAQQAAAKQYVQWLASTQIRHGAQFVGVCVDKYGGDVSDRVKAMEWIVPALQEASNRPLAIEADDPRVLRAGLEVYDGMNGGRPMFVAASLDQPPLFKLAAQHRAHTVVLTHGHDRLTRVKTAGDRMKHAVEGVGLATKAGIPPTDIYLDPLVTPAAKDVKACDAILDAIRQMHHRWPEVHIAGRHGTIGDRLPLRDTVALVWLRMAMAAGCDAGMIDPQLVDLKRLSSVDWSHPAFQMAEDGLTGKDRFFAEFVAATQTQEVADPLADI